MKIIAILFVSLFVYSQVLSLIFIFFFLFSQLQCAYESTDCVAGLTDDVRRDIENGNFYNPVMGKYLFCLNQLLGVQDYSGRLKIPRIKIYLKKFNENIQRQAEQKCLRNRETPEMTALNLARCMRSVLPFKRT